MGSQPIRIQCGKILREMFAGKSCGKSLRENVCGKILREMFAGKVFGKMFVGKSCGKCLRENLVENHAEKVLMVCNGSKNGKKPPI